MRQSVILLLFLVTCYYQQVRRCLSEADCRVLKKIQLRQDMCLQVMDACHRYDTSLTLDIVLIFVQMQDLQGRQNLLFLWQYHSKH